MQQYYLLSRLDVEVWQCLCVQQYYLLSRLDVEVWQFCVDNNIKRYLPLAHARGAILEWLSWILDLFLFV